MPPALVPPHPDEHRAARAGDARHHGKYRWPSYRGTKDLFLSEEKKKKRKGFIFLDPLSGGEVTRSFFSLDSPRRNMGIIHCCVFCDVLGLLALGLDLTEHRGQLRSGSAFPAKV